MRAVDRAAPGPGVVLMTKLVKARRVAAGVVMSLTLFCSLALAQAPTSPEPPKTWTGSAGAGVSITSGNSDTANYNLAFDVTRTPKARTVMTWTGLYLRGDQNDSTVVNRTSLGFRDEYSLSTRTFLFGQIDYLRDAFKLIDYLVSSTAGVGYKVIDTAGLAADAHGHVQARDDRALEGERSRRRALHVVGRTGDQDLGAFAALG